MLAVFTMFVLLSYLLFNPAREFLKKRQEKIQADLDQAEKERADGEAFKAEYDLRLQNADAEAESILSESRQKALKHQDEVIASAKEEAGRIMARAEQEAALEKLKVRDQVKQEMITVATAMAGKFVASSMDQAKQDALIDETLQEMGESTWQS
ncbi:MAG: F0F1 ATP synthase subunit B [Lachnospiraceae bacterium]|nr:F0F1 ATP synthase subunit B [Lachnospiraceae bacterium]